MACSDAGRGERQPDERVLVAAPGQEVDRRHVDRVPRHDVGVVDDHCPIGEHDLPHPGARRRDRAVHCGHLRAEAVSSVSLWAGGGND